MNGLTLIYASFAAIALLWIERDLAKIARELKNIGFWLELIYRKKNNKEFGSKVEEIINDKD